MTPEERFIQWSKIALGLAALALSLYAVHLLHIIAYGK
jgi:hypothetical protein